MKQRMTGAATVLMLACLTASTAGAGNVGLDMGEMVVTATRTEVAKDSVGGNSITVISSEEIDAKQVSTVADLLRSIPGVSISSNGGPGTATSVFTRGADSKNTLVLVDGIMVNDVSSANRSADLGHLNVDNIQQIEVIRGAMSVMYGSNATAGVINIITRKGASDPTASLRLEAGSYGTWKAAASASGAVDRLRFSISASLTEIDGFSVANDENSDIPRGSSTDEKDGYENLTLSASAGMDITDNFSISGVIRHIDADTDGDGYNWNGYAEDSDADTDARQTLAKIDIDNRLMNGLVTSKLSWQTTRQDRDYFEYGADTSTYEGETDTVSWQGDLHLESQTLSVGAAYYEEQMESESFGAWGTKFAEKSVDTKSAWIQDQFFGIDNLTLIAGVRIDDHEEFGHKATFRIAPAYTFAGTGTTLKASYGTGFRAPSLYELYDPNYGNADLDAEESDGWDLGVEQRLLEGTLTLGATWFSMDYDNRIDFDLTTWTYAQAAGTTRTEGLELFARWQPVSGLDLDLNYTYTDTEDPDGNTLVRRPENKVGLNTLYRFMEKGTANLEVQWVDERKASPYANDKDGNPVGTLDAYTLVNLAASWDINPAIRIFGRVDNLLDEFYEEAFSYAKAGVSAYGGIVLTY